jgi:diguanylate cyclase
MGTVLVIENDGANRENILKILRFKSFRAMGAANGEMGIEIAKKYLPDLILCDISMPGLDGYGMLETLGRFPATQTIPVIFITAKATPAEVQYARSLGVSGYLVKPFGCSGLLEAIGAVSAKQRDRCLLTLKPVSKAAATDSARGYLSHRY